LNQFLDLIKQPGPDIPRDAQDETSTDPNAKHDLTLSLVDGSIPALNQTMHTAADSSDNIWHVRAGTFTFRVDSKFALSSVSVNTDSVHSPYSVYATPMWISDPITSHMEITVNTQTEPGFDWQFTPVVKMMPSAIWAPCKAFLDLSLPLLLTSAIIPHLYSPSFPLRATCSASLPET
jgi:hypothetical protein